jgi:hypothetical protein
VIFGLLNFSILRTSGPERGIHLELARPSQKNIADEMQEERSRWVLL